MGRSIRIKSKHSESDMLYMWCAMVHGLSSNLALKEVKFLYYIVKNSDRAMWTPSAENVADLLEELDISKNGYKMYTRQLRKKGLISYNEKYGVWALGKMLVAQPSEKTSFIFEKE